MRKITMGLLGALLFLAACEGTTERPASEAVPTATRRAVSVDAAKVQWETMANRYLNSDAEMPAWQYVPKIAVDGAGNALAVWTDYRHGDADVYSAYRPANGDWEAAVQVGNSKQYHEQFMPQIGMDGAGNAWAVWIENEYGLYAAYRPAGGEWGPGELIPGTEQGGGSSLVVDKAGNIYLLWADFRRDRGDIYFAYRPVDGEWEEPVAVDPRIPPGEQCAPALTVDEAGHAYAVWEDGRKDDGGLYFSSRGVDGTWEVPERISTFKYFTNDYYPDVVSDKEGGVYVVWLEKFKDDTNINFAYRLAGGDWTVEKQIDDVLKLDHADAPVLIIDAKNTIHLFLAIQELDLRSGHNRENNSDVQWVYSLERAAGEEWELGERVDDNRREIGIIRDPEVVIDSRGNFYAVWADGREWVNDIYFAYRKASGVWRANERISDDPFAPRQVNPSLALDGKGNVYALWQENKNNSSELYFSYRPTLGKWEAREKVYDDSGPAAPINPTLAVDAAGNAYALWQNHQGSFNDLYFSWRPAGGHWQTATPMYENFENREFPVLRSDAAGNLYALWLNHEFDVYFSYRPVGGKWEEGELLADTWRKSGAYPTLAVNRKGEACAAWVSVLESGNSTLTAMCRRADGTWGNHRDFTTYKWDRV